MMNQLSMKSYHKEKLSGRLGKNRQLVYDIMRLAPDISNKQILNIAQKTGYKLSINSITGRTRELVVMGMAESIKRGKDADTGNTVNLWRITGRTIPLELPKKPNKDRIIQQLREENAKLKTENATLNDTICGIARSVYE